MGWVVLTLRKKELKRTHADYQMRDLQIAREQRQMSRQYQYEQSVIQGQQNEEVRDLRTSYNYQRSSLRDQLSVLREDHSESGSSETAAEIADIQSELEQLQLTYSENTNDVKTFYETELAMIEEEANDIETMYEQEKVDVESQMESVSQEIQSVSDAISNAIQQSTIKLS